MGRAHTAKGVRALIAFSAVPFAVLAAGCSEEDDYANRPRPPSPVLISAAISPERVSISPRELGAGPVTLIVTNQTQRSQEITLETDEIGGSAPGIEQRSGPINPGDTASLKADLAEGTYSVGVDGSGIGAATLRVGEERPSAQDELLQP
jgi:hypothetical protein